VSESSAYEPMLENAIGLLASAASDPDLQIDEQDLQRLMAASVRLYVSRLERGDAGLPIPPAHIPDAPTATEVLVTVTHMLAAADIELFELGMWQTWGGVGSAAPVGGSDGR
jgi:hypothetical protein